MGTMVGADIAELRQLAGDFRAASRRIDGASRQLAPAIMRGSWQGRDADRFRQRWSSRLLPCLEDASATLAEASRRCARRPTSRSAPATRAAASAAWPDLGRPWPHPLPDPDDPIPYPPGGWPGPWPPPFFPVPMPPGGWPIPWPDGPFGEGGLFGEDGFFQIEHPLDWFPGGEVSLAAKGDHWFTPNNTTNDPNSTTPNPN